jgi:hypothetical protein
MGSSAENPQPTTVQGACLCRAVRYEVDLPTRFCIHCHCSMCQRNHGAAFVTWFAVPKSQFRLTDGESVLTRYQSSDKGSRSFCSRCGSSLFCVNDRDPEIIDITLASTSAPIDRAPQAHVYFDTHADWVNIVDELPKMGTPSRQP